MKRDEWKWLDLFLFCDCCCCCMTKKWKLFYSRLFCALINCEILWKALKIPFWMRKLLFEHSFFLLLLLLLLNTTMTMTKSKILHAHCWKHDKVFIFVRWNVCDILTAVEISLFFSLTGFSMFVSILICIIYFQLEKERIMIFLTQKMQILFLFIFHIHPVWRISLTRN